MPKVKLLPLQETEKVLRMNIAYYSSGEDVTTKELAMAVKIDQTTLYRKLRSPKTFKVSELQKLASYFRISVSELLGGTGERNRA